HRAGLAVEPDQTLLAQEVVRLVHGVEVDPEVRGERSDRRQRAAFGQYTLGDGFDDPIPQLLVERHLAGQVDVQDHKPTSALTLYVIEQTQQVPVVSRDDLSGDRQQR